jgi:hypothetical protein
MKLFAPDGRLCPALLLPAGTPETSERAVHDVAHTTGLQVEEGNRCRQPLTATVQALPTV